MQSTLKYNIMSLSQAHLCFVLRSLRHCLRHRAMDTTPLLAWKCSMTFKRPRQGYHQSDEHWNSFKGYCGKTSDRWGGVHMVFSPWVQRYHLELNWTPGKQNPEANIILWWPTWQRWLWSLQSLMRKQQAICTQILGDFCTSVPSFLFTLAIATGWVPQHLLILSSWPVKTSVFLSSVVAVPLSTGQDACLPCHLPLALTQVALELSASIVSLCSCWAFNLPASF